MVKRSKLLSDIKKSILQFLARSRDIAGLEGLRKCPVRIKTQGEKKKGQN